MGRDKALLAIAGRTLLDRAVETVRQAGGVPLVLGPRRAAAGLDEVGFLDDAPGDGERAGPLSALRCGLRACGTRVAVALACDLPLVTPAWLRFLVLEAERHPAVVPRAAGELQVLAAAYTTGCLEAMETGLAAGDRSVHGFLESVAVRIVEPAELLPFGGEAMFLNVNTPEDLRRAEERLRDAGA